MSDADLKAALDHAIEEDWQESLAEADRLEAEDKKREPKPDEYAMHKQGIRIFRTEEIDRPAYGSVTLRIENNQFQSQTVRLTQQDFERLKEQVNQFDTGYSGSPVTVVEGQRWRRKSDGREIEVMELAPTGKHLSWRYPGAVGTSSALKISTFHNKYELIPAGE